MLEVGVVTRSFSGMSAEECASRMAGLGFFSTELCFTFSDADYWAYNGRKDMSALTAAKASKIVKEFESRGIKVVSVGAFSNLIEPDEDALNGNFRFFERHIEIAADNGIKYVSTENGFVPGRRGINTDTYEKDYAYFQKNMARLCEIAEKHGVYIAFEPCLLDLTPSAKRTRDFISQLGSPRLKILLDPANLIANSDEEDMFKYLSPHVAYFHGKDRRVNDTYGRNLGEGDIDWVKFFSLYHENTEGVPFILEYVNSENCAKVRDIALEFDKQAEQAK